LPEPAPLELPAAAGTWNDPNLLVTLTFPVDMDQGEIPNPADFTLKYDAEEIAGDSFQWQSATLANMSFLSEVMPVGEMTLDYAKGITPLKALDEKEYDSWLALPVIPF